MKSKTKVLPDGPDLDYEIGTETRFSQKYRLGERIGGGGMAEVYRSTLVGAEGFSRTVAVKKILGSFSADPIFAEMFVNEANIASLLNHPNIVSVLDFDRDDSGQLFLVMELIEGCDLKQLVDRGRLPFSIAGFIACEILRALAFAHALEQEGRPLSIVHRDISPHNVLVSWDGAVKLSDFGIAKAAEATRVTQSGLIKGKIGYMSPEQVEGLPLDGRSDLFAVGILLHEILTGQRLFGGAPDRVVLNRILIAPMEPPSRIIPEIPPALDAICMKLLDREVEHRYQHAGEALEALLSSDLISPRAQLDLARMIKARLDDPPRLPAVAPVEAALTEPIPTRRLQDSTRTHTTGSPLAEPGRRARGPIALALAAAVAAILVVRLTRDVPGPPVPTPVQAIAPLPAQTPPPPPTPTRLRITSTPSGARVFLDGAAEPAGVTPFELPSEAGETRSIVLRLEGYRAATHVLRGEDLHVELAPARTPKKRKKKVRGGILPAEPRPEPPTEPGKEIGDGILRPNL